MKDKFEEQLKNEFNNNVVQEYQLNYNAGWYQIKCALKSLAGLSNIDYEKLDSFYKTNIFTDFDNKYKELEKEIVEGVYEYGFLRM